MVGLRIMSINNFLRIQALLNRDYSKKLLSNLVLQSAPSKLPIPVVKIVLGPMHPPIIE